MTLKETISAELDRFAIVGVSKTTPETLQIETESGRLECLFTRIDSLGCAFFRLALASDKLAGASVNELRQLSETLSERLSYLLEPIAPIEIDAEGCVVQMRSQPPSREDEETSYYELAVRREGIALCRWRRQKGQPRSQTECQVTREVFLRLARDFEEAVKCAFGKAARGAKTRGRAP